MTALMTMHHPTSDPNYEYSYLSTSLPTQLGPSPLSMRTELAKRTKVPRAATFNGTSNINHQQRPSASRTASSQTTARSRALSNNPDTSTLYISATTSRQTDGSYVGLVKPQMSKPDFDSSPAYDVSAQTEFILQKIRGIISHASDGKASLDSVIDATVFLVDAENNFEAMDAVWKSYWPDSSRAPIRTCTSVSSLQDPRARVEVKAIAVLDEER